MDLKNILTRDMEMQSLGIPHLALALYRSTISSCAFRNGEIYTVNLEVYGVLFLFLSMIT